MKSRREFLFALLALPLTASAQAPFEHAHTTWDTLLRKHVKLVDDGKGRANASQVDYKAFAQERSALAAYLQSLSAVTPAQYAGWTRQQQYAFLANAYNAFTIQKVLTRYPNVKSIRDFGTGIAPELMGRLFEPFVTTKSDGLGLGLSISRTIVTAHGGRLWAENNADGGATVHFVVPSTVSRGITAPAIASVLARYHQP
jgi:light-regulated signal transduction histidine kinase (bacteriophytochrome)